MRALEDTQTTTPGVARQEVMVSLDMVSTTTSCLSPVPLLETFRPPRICKACQRIVLRKIVYMFPEIQLGQVYKLLNSKNAGKYFSPRLNKLLIV